MACARGRSAAWKPAACVQGAGKHRQNNCKAYAGAARRLTAHYCLARPYTRPQPVLVSKTDSRAMRRVRTSVRCGRMARSTSCTRLNANSATSAGWGARCMQGQRSARRMAAPSAPARASARARARDAPPSSATPRSARKTACSALLALLSCGPPSSPLASPQPVAGTPGGPSATCPAGHDNCSASSVGCAMSPGQACSHARAPQWKRPA